MTREQREYLKGFQFAALDCDGFKRDSANPAKLAAAVLGWPADERAESKGYTAGLQAAFPALLDRSQSTDF